MVPSWLFDMSKLLASTTLNAVLTCPPLVVTTCDVRPVSVCVFSMEFKSMISSSILLAPVSWSVLFTKKTNIQLRLEAMDFGIY